MLRIKFFLFSVAMFVLAPIRTLDADGNVEVEVSNNGDVRVRCEDDTDQSIVVQQVGNRLFFSDPLNNDTTFNGSDILTVLNFTGDLRIDLRSGRKELAIGSVPAPVDISGDLRISSTGNDPAIIVLGTLMVAGQTSIKTKNGDDAVWSNGSPFPGMPLSFLGGVKVNTGKGADNISMPDVILGDLQIQTGSGNDIYVNFGRRFDGKANFKFGKGSDACSFDRCVFNQEVTVNGGGDTDSFFSSLDTQFNDELIFTSVENTLADFDDINSLLGSRDGVDRAIDISQFVLFLPRP